MNLFICNCRIFHFVPLDGATGKKCGFYKTGEIRTVINMQMGKQYSLYRIEVGAALAEAEFGAAAGIHYHHRLAMTANEITGGCTIGIKFRSTTA